MNEQVPAVPAWAPSWPESQAPAPRLGEMLLADGHLEQDDLDKALAFQADYGGRLGSILVRMGAVSEADLLAVLSRQLQLGVLDPDDLPNTPQPLASAIEMAGLAPTWWLDQEIIAWTVDDGGIRIIARDLMQDHVVEIAAGGFRGQPTTLLLARGQDIDRALELLRAIESANTHTETDISHLREMADEAPVVELVANTLSQAFNENASDIHVEPGERQFRIRFRIDGVLQTRFTLPRERFDAVASRVKLIAGIDIAERRLPQDGRLSTRLNGKEIDVRVSAVPGVWGESIVLRLLPKERKAFSLDRLGMEPDHIRLYRQVIQEPHGIILVTGPTGSGKSTTLYATLEAINDGEQKIITVEDPVEYNVPGVSQIQVHSDIGYTFARALRAILRQDPDTIMIGEIRDLETAEIAVQAALTGHMVFSTLHTNDALGAFTRLIDMGVEPFLVATSVRLVMSQRLVRRLCTDCAEPQTPPPEIMADVKTLKDRYRQLLESKPNFHAARGCKVCQGIGYRGRLAIYEMASVDAELHDAVLRHATSRELMQIVVRAGHRTLREDGFVKAYRGETSLEEILRVTGLGEDVT
ncbi:MAG: Flp pilus assembly complex ATPase component TadA [Proteobacteria bacterium]|nr:Flp pilus assembly complex ATPase component TadA [Pseudomonadota bacterium]